jgi:putative AlgH/UPF0301 family transcriptional regulator
MRSNVYLQVLASLASLLAAMAIAPSAMAHEHRSVDLATPMVLSATPALDAGGYRETVLLAVPRTDGGHFGFVLNRPTTTRLSELFPEDEAARRVDAPVHFGGPHLVGAIFAVVHETTGEAPSDVIHVSPRIHIAVDESAVDRVIADGATNARFFVGLVVWQPGELAHELRAGAWSVHAVDSDLVMTPDSATLWDRLASASQSLPLRRGRTRSA